MDAVIDRDTLLAAVSRAALVTDATSLLHALGNVQLTASGRTLRLFATDLYMSSDESVEAEVIESGVVALPANELLNILARVPRGPVQLTGGDTVRIHPVGRSLTYFLSGGSGDDTLRMPELPTGPWAAMNGESVLDGFRAVVRCALTHEASSANAVLWTSDGMGTTYVATDGHRLGIAQRGSATPVTFSALVPLDAVEALVIGRTRGETMALPPWISRGLVEVAVHSDVAREYLFLRNAGRVFCVKLPKMAFPPYANVIPERFTVSALVNGRALLDTIRDVTAATAPESVGVLLTVMPGRIRVAYDCETVKSSGEAPVDYCGAASPSIGLDPKLVTDALLTLDGDVFIGINGKEDPIVISSAGHTGADTNKYIIMPMRK